MKRKPSGSIEIKFAGARALVKQRGDGLWVVRWREAGKGRNTTSPTKERALELARATVKRLSGNQGGRLLTAEDAELVARLKRVAGDRAAHSVLAQIEDAVTRLGGWEALGRALSFYEQSGMTKVVRVSMLHAKNRFLDLYDDKAQFTRAGVRKELAAFVAASTPAPAADAPPPTEAPAESAPPPAMPDPFGLIPCMTRVAPWLLSEVRHGMRPIHFTPP